MEESNTNCNTNNYKQIGNALREIICNKYTNGKTIKDISTELDCKYTTVQSVIKNFRNENRICSAKYKCGRKKKINESDATELRKLIADDCSVTLDVMKDKLAQSTSKIVSKSTIHRALRNFEYSFKRVQLVPIKRNATNNIETRFQYANKIMELDNQRLIFIDEMGVNCSMRKRYGRAIVGETPKKNVTTIRSKNISIAAAMTKSKIIQYKIKEGAYNKVVYIDFLRDVVNELENKNMCNMIFIMDNVPFHHSVEVLELISTHGHALLYLPPYTPQLNPIEEAFSAWKERVRNCNCNSQESLNAAVMNSVISINESMCNAFFNHMQVFLVKALLRENF